MMVAVGVGRARTLVWQVVCRASGAATSVGEFVRRHRQWCVCENVEIMGF